MENVEENSELKKHCISIKFENPGKFLLCSHAKSCSCELNAGLHDCYQKKFDGSFSKIDTINLSRISKKL